MNEVVLIGDSNVNRLQAFNRNPNWSFIGISGADLIKNGESVTCNIVKQLPLNRRMNLVFWLGNEVDTAAQMLSSTDILDGHDTLATKLYNGLLSRQHLRPKDPLRILNLFKGKLLQESNLLLDKYIEKLRILVSACCRKRNIHQITLLLMGPRAKKNMYEDILVNLLTYYINQKVKVIVEQEPQKITKTTTFKYMDFFFPYFAAGRWKKMDLELFSPTEKDLSRKYGAVHYATTIYEKILELVKR